MKKLVVTSLVFLMVLLVGSSCSKDEDSEAGNGTASLEGKWQFSQDGELINNKEVLVNYVHETGCTKDYIEFLKSGVFKAHFFENPNCQEETDTASWIKNNNSVVLKAPNETFETFEILQLTNTTLKIKSVDAGVTYFQLFTRI